MPLFHRRCGAIEALLVSRINDLEEQMAEMRQREIELIDRLIVVVNPAGAAALRSLEPAPQPPALLRKPTPIKPGDRAALTPMAAGHRPSQPAPPPKPPGATIEESVAADAAAERQG